MSDTKHISIRIPEEILSMVDEQAEKFRWSRSATINTCIEFGLVDLEKENGPGVKTATGALKRELSSLQVNKVVEKIGEKIKKVSEKENNRAWFPNSMCPHGYMNSFACEKENGGCGR